MNNSEIAHTFAHKDYGRNGGRKGSNMLSDESGETLYSYGYHFPICTHLDAASHAGFELAFTTSSYSRTTSEHISYAGIATSHLKTLYCYNPENARNGRHKENLQEFAREAMEAAQAYRGRDTMADADRMRKLLTALDNWKAYCKAFKVTQKIIAAIAPDALKIYKSLNAGRDDLQAQAKKTGEAIRKAKAKREAQAKAKLEKQARKTLPEWIAGGNIHYYFQSLPVALRIKPDFYGRLEVQTSHGASVPIAAARKLWPIVCKAREAGRAIVPKKARQVGFYNLSRIEASGLAVIGCHRIPFEAMRAISAEVMNTKTETTNH